MRLKIIGHRGAAGLADENTLASIQAALDSGVDQIEVDVRVTSDSQVVLAHDKQVGDKLVSQYTFEQLNDEKPNLCTLHEAVTLVNRFKPLIIEIKPGEPTKPICDIIQKFLANGWKPTDFFIASFDQKILRTMYNELPDLTLIVLESYWSLKAVRRARELKTKYTTMNQRYIWWGFVRFMTKRGYRLSCYTLNDPKRAAKLARHGLYGVTTDYPNRFKDY